MKKVFSLIMLMFSFAVLFAQEKSVVGRVTDEASEPLPGVNVILKGTTMGTITDADGKFKITIPAEKSILQFSFIGFENQEVDAKKNNIINVQLKSSTIGIDEVVAVGYGTTKKVNLTGSVESIGGAEIASHPVTQVSQALVGMVPGLTAIQSSGQPGKDNAVLRIRGVGSLDASNDPLVLIDGVEGDINNLNSNDIENISVLKDAAASSIYGSRGSNGVILVITKRAKAGEMSVNYSNYVGWQKVTEQPKYLGALDFLKYSGASQSVIDNYRAGMVSNPDKYPDTDWIKELFTENGFQQNHNLSVNGGTEKAKVLASVSYLQQGANIVNFNYKRYNGRLNSDLKLSEKFDVNFDLSFSRALTESPSASLSVITHQAYRIPPIYSAIHSDGTWGDGWDGTNPVAYAHDGGKQTNQVNYFRGTLKANYSPVHNLKVTLMYSPEYSDVLKKKFIKIYKTIIDWDAKTTRDMPNRNSFSEGNERSFTDNFNALITYEKKIGDHHLNFLAGYEFIKYQYEIFDASRQDFIIDSYQVLNAGSASTQLNSGSATQSGLVSYFGRVNYSLKDKYLFEANLRRDASSRFAEDNRVSYFPSFSAGWRLSQESFIQDMGLFSNLKLRASWGQLGNQQVGTDFPYASSIVIGSNYLFGNTISTGATQNVLANSGIKWETTETANVGVDAGFVGQKLTLSTEYYVRKTKDILLILPIPLVVGLSPSLQNAGNVKNTGWDLSMAWQDKIGDFSYGASLNISDVKNEVTNLAGVGPIISGNTITKVGSPIGLIYGYKTAGIFQDATTIAAAPSQFGVLKPGNLQYTNQLTVDTNADGIPDATDGLINSDDRVVIGNPFPRMSFGLNLNAGYKGFDLSVSLQGVGKRDVLLQGDMVWPLFNAGKIQEWQVREFWSPENTNASFPIIAATSSGSNDAQVSSTWVFNASYLRVRNVSIGYTFPQAYLKNKFINQLRIYFSGENMFTFDHLPQGIDPLIPNDTQGDIFPINSSYSFGIDLKF